MIRTAHDKKRSCAGVSLYPIICLTTIWVFIVIYESLKWGESKPVLADVKWSKATDAWMQ